MAAEQPVSLLPIISCNLFTCLQFNFTLFYYYSLVNRRAHAHILNSLFHNRIDGDVSEDCSCSCQFGKWPKIFLNIF